MNTIFLRILSSVIATVLIGCAPQPRPAVQPPQTMTGQPSASAQPPGDQPPAAQPQQLSPEPPAVQPPQTATGQQTTFVSNQPLADEVTPDPWPKTRHHKRRLIQPANVALLRSRLVPGGLFHCATDVDDYARSMMDDLRTVMRGKTLTDLLPDQADPDSIYVAFAEWATDQGLVLYPHQEEALIEVVSGANVILSTPTGSGSCSPASLAVSGPGSTSESSLCGRTIPSSAPSALG